MVAIVQIVLLVALSAYCGMAANKMGYSRWAWFVETFLAGPATLVCLGRLPNRARNRRREQERACLRQQLEKRKDRPPGPDNSGAPDDHTIGGDLTVHDPII